MHSTRIAQWPALRRPGPRAEWSPVVLLHGFLGTPASWTPVVDALPPGRDVWAVALPGHAPGHRVRHASLDEAATELAHALLRVSPRWSMAGYSLGGRVALGIATSPLGRALDRLVLVGAHPGLEDDAQRAARVDDDERWCQRLESLRLAAFLDAWEERPLFASQARLSEDVRTQRRQQRLRHEPRELARALRTFSLGRMPSRWSHPPLAHETCLLTGARDRKFTELAARYANLHRLEHRVVPDAGHDVTLEAPAAVAAALEYYRHTSG